MQTPCQFSGLRGEPIMKRLLAVFAVLFFTTACASTNGSGGWEAGLNRTEATFRMVEPASSQDACVGGDLFGRGLAGGSVALTAGSTVALTMMMGTTPDMPLEERMAIEQQVTAVLDQESDGRTVEWVSPRSGMKMRFSPSRSQSEFRRITVARNEGMGRMPESFRVEEGIYRLKRDSVLRPTPSAAANFNVDRVRAGDRVRVMGRVSGLYGDSWLLIGGPNGAAYGYLDPADLEPVSRTGDNIYTRSTAGVIRDPVNASVLCRTLTVDALGRSETLTACRQSDGRWIADPPMGNAQSACLPVNPAFLLTE